MTTAHLIPGLAIDDELYAAAAAGLATHAADLPSLTWETFTDPARWWLIPDEDGDAYKAEFELLKTRACTYKANIWFLPDLRGGRAPKPHSHPWDFTAHVLLGGYTEDRYVLDAGVVLPNLGIEHRAGEANVVPRVGVLHEVVDVHEPGRTLTLMVCDRGVRGGWGYLDVATGEYLPAEPDPHFEAKLGALNPHRQLAA